MKYLPLKQKKRVKLPKCGDEGVLKNSQNVGIKLPKVWGNNVLIPLFIGVCVEVIEHITDDAYKRQGSL